MAKKEEFIKRFRYPLKANIIAVVSVVLREIVLTLGIKQEKIGMLKCDNENNVDKLTKLDGTECIICGNKIDINDLFVCSNCKNKSYNEIKEILETKGITDKAFWTIMCIHLLGGCFNIPQKNDGNTDYEKSWEEMIDESLSEFQKIIDEDVKDIEQSIKYGVENKE